MAGRVSFGNGEKLDAASRATKRDCDEAPSGHALRLVGTTWGEFEADGQLTGQQLVLSWSTAEDCALLAPRHQGDAELLEDDRVTNCTAWWLSWH